MCERVFSWPDGATRWFVSLFYLFPLLFPLLLASSIRPARGLARGRLPR